MVRKILGAIIGAAVVFAWTSISWMVLSWHDTDMKMFKDDGAAVVEALKKEATESGLYSLPNFAKDLHATKMDVKDVEQAKAKQKEWMDKAHKGPFVFLSVKNEGMQWDMKRALINQFVLQLIVALIAAFLLATTAIENFLGRALFVCFAVTSGALLSDLSMWNWWGFPTMSSLINVADVAIGWLLAGLVMAKIVRN